MIWNTQSKVILGFSIAVTMLFAIAALALYSGEQLKANTALVTHTYEVLNVKDQLDAHLLNLQAASRGYVISGDGAFEGKVTAALATINTSIASLRTLLSDNPGQLDRLRQLVELTAKRAARTHEVIRIRTTQGHAPASAMVMSGEGVELMDQTRAVLSDLEREERRLLTERIESTRQSGERTIQIVFIGCILALGVSALAGISVNRDLTLRRQSELALERSAKEINDLYNRAPCGYHSLDREGRFVRINDTELAWLGYERHEVEGKLRFQDICAPESQAQFHGVFARFLERGEVRNVEYVLQRKDGTPLPVQLSATVVTGPDGEYVMSRSVMLDITDRRMAQDALTKANADLEQRVADRTADLQEANESLKRSEELFAAFMDNSPAYAWMKDGDGRYLYINRAHEERFGRKREHVIGQDDFDLWDQPTARKLRDNDRAVVDANRVTEFNEILADVDGGFTSLLSFKFPIVTSGAGGAETLVGGMAVDITARQQAEDKVLRLNRMYAVLSHVNAAIVRVRDRDALFQHLCEIAVTFGQFRMAWVGLSDQESQSIVPVAHAGADKDYILKTRVSAADTPEGQGPTGRAIRDGACAVCPDIQSDPRMQPWREHIDRIGYRSAAAIPLRFQGAVVGSFSVYAGEVAFFTADETALLEEIGSAVSFALDAIDHETRRREAEQEVQRLNTTLERRVTERTALLEAANQELEAFSYSVSHDLRSPLRSIDGFSLALLEDYSNAFDEKGKDYLRRVRAATQRMGLLIDDLLGLSRVSRRELKRERINLSAAAGDALKALAESDGARAVEIHIEEGLEDSGDPHLIRIVLDNLLANAWKFTSKKDHAQIRFGRLPDTAPNTYVVRDNGAGFDPAYADRLFGAFQRLHSTQEFPGTGIGLATVQRIIRRHGGHIWAEAEAGAGAAFFFTLE